MNNQNIFERFASKNQERNFLDQPNSSLQPNEEEIAKENIFERVAKQKEMQKNDELGFFDTILDVGQQIFKKGASGLSGAYGNILESFGLQHEQGTQLPGEQLRNKIEFDIQEKLSRGEIPSFGEFMLLSDEGFPVGTRLPTSKEIESGVERLTGIGEGKTPSGRITGRGAELASEGLATGSGVKGLAGLAASGLAGQSIRETAGGGPLATGVEIVGSLLAPSIEGKVRPLGITKSGKEAKEITEAGRKLGLAEKEIAPLIQGEAKSQILSKIARKGTKTKERFEEIKQRLGDSYSEIKGRPEASRALPNAEQINLRKEFGQIRNELSKTLAPSPDKEGALKYIETSLDTLRNANITPEYLVNFWQDINRSVKWNSIQGGKKALTRLKEPVKNALNKVSPGLAEDFELTNKLYTKYAQISKKLKPGLVDSFVNKGELIGSVPAAIALVQGNPWALVGLGSEVALRLLTREMLISPYFQNISTKLATNLNEGTIQSVTRLVKNIREYMERKHPNEKWDFLTDVKED